MRREKWEQQHFLRISFCFNSLPALPQPHPLIFPSQFAFISRSLPPCNHIPLHLFLQCFTSTTPPSAAPSHLPFLSSCLFFPLLLFPPSLFLCSCVPSISPPFWTFDRSFRNHILKRILDITNPHRTLPVCGWMSASFFLLCFCSHGLLYCRHRRRFLLGVRVRTMRTGMRFLAVPYVGPHDTSCHQSSISTSVAHLWCTVVRHRHPGTGHVTLLFFTSGAVSCLVVSFIVHSLALPCDVPVHSCSAGYHGCEVLPWKEIGSVRHLVR